MECDERDRLEAEYNNAICESLRAQTELLAASAKAPAEDNGLFLREWQRCAGIARKARALYLRHLQQHRCAKLPTGAESTPKQRPYTSKTEALQ
jgi:hypothetical protein